MKKKNKNECKIVQDLLPTYIEDLTQKETKEFIQNHLEWCEDCRDELTGMNDNIEMVDIEQKEIDYLKKIRRKNIYSIITGIIIGISIIILFHISIIIYRFYTLKELNSKINNYDEINNFYIETTYNSFIGSETVNNLEQFWYKDGILKRKHSSTYPKDEITYFVDYNKQVEYIINHTNNTVDIKKNNDIFLKRNYKKR